MTANSDEKKTLVVVSYQEEPLDAYRMGAQGGHVPKIRETSHIVQADVLQDSIVDVADVIEGSFREIEKRQVAGLALDTVEVKLEITAEGKVALLGTGGSLKGSASLTLTFKRPKAKV